MLGLCLGVLKIVMFCVDVFFFMIVFMLFNGVVVMILGLVVIWVRLILGNGIEFRKGLVVLDLMMNILIFMELMVCWVFIWKLFVSLVKISVILKISLVLMIVMIRWCFFYCMLCRVVKSIFRCY